MNQILSMGGGLNSNNGGMNNIFGDGNQGSKKGTLETKTTVLIFAIVLIVFGLAISIMGFVNLFGNSDAQNVLDNRWPTFEANQQDNKLYLTISNNKVIDKVLYHWNSGFDTTVSGNNMTFVPLDLIVPVGDNILTLTVIDETGKETPYQSRFVGVAIEEEPEIQLSRIDSKINVVAKSTTDTKLSYISYNWNGGEEMVIEPTYDDYLIETQVVIPVGENELTVTAVKENGMKKTKSLAIKGLVKPVITITKKDNIYLEVTITHDSGIANAKVTLDSREINLTADRFGEDKKSVSFTVYLKEGQSNFLTVDTTSCDGANVVKTYEAGNKM